MMTYIDISLRVYIWMCMYLWLYMTSIPLGVFLQECLARARQFYSSIVCMCKREK